MLEPWASPTLLFFCVQTYTYHISYFCQAHQEHWTWSSVYAAISPVSIATQPNLSGDGGGLETCMIDFCSFKIVSSPYRSKKATFGWRNGPIGRQERHIPSGAGFYNKMTQVISLTRKQWCKKPVRCSWRWEGIWGSDSLQYGLGFMSQVGWFLI